MMYCFNKSMRILVLVMLLYATCMRGGKVKDGDDSLLQQKVLEYASALDAKQVAVESRSLVVYHVGNVTSEDSLDVLVNNVKFFASAVAQHSEVASHHAFYIFRVAGGHRSKLVQHVPAEAINIAVVRCLPIHTDLQTHMHTVVLLGDAVSKFHSAIFLNHHSRGPFVDRANGAWMQHFTSPLIANSQLGLIGSTLSCESSPHVQTHAFAMRTTVAMQVFGDLRPNRSHPQKHSLNALEFSITSDVLGIGYNISSLYHQRKAHVPVFNGDCLQNQSSSCSLFKANPTSWCDLSPTELVFLSWGGAPMRLRGFYCQDTMDRVRDATLAIAVAERTLQLVLPETIHGGHFYGISKEFDLEMWRDRAVVPHTVHALHSPEDSAEAVCFLVRSAFMQGEIANSRTVRMDLNVLIKSLLRQTNPNWEAYFFVTDDHPFEQDLQLILAKHGDIRLNYVHLEPRFRPRYDPKDAAYPASDEAMRIVSQKPQCAWLSVTNGDNAYGSAVVAKVLEGRNPRPNLIMMPMSSRNFDNMENLRARLSRSAKATYADFCVDFERLYQRHKYGFARVPSPEIGSVDIAELFIERDKFVSTNLYFNDFSSTKVDTCAGCQDGAWTFNMVHQRNWTTHRPPLTDMGTMVYHGPSPLWCVAGGHVWFDHGGKRTPANACVSHKTVGALFPHSYFDWDYYHMKGSPKICLRLSEVGFANKAKKEAKFA